ncbi:MAG: indole-3-glycerol phosphate synthase TrpC [Oculatellaceae cyanobacterium Prado106]|jgi:indole-3-glycerol phosphate synthase|nr:indole-3-glycerol phosphate synthase TrpC [Oculatellaceae cyanobacterium Prado106]
MSALQYPPVLPTLPIAEPPEDQSMLNKIVWHKHQEVEQLRQQLSLYQLKQSLDAPRATTGFLGALRQSSQKPSLIAEVKKASPSRGVIRVEFDPVAIAQTYEKAGAACISVLTDQAYFQGSFEYLWAVRKAVSIPLLCKEFIVDPYQIYLARSFGADAVLLIAAVLEDELLQELLQLAYQLGMNALVEVHTLAELDRVLALPEVCLVGINNRSLSTFTVDIQTTQNLLIDRRTQLEDLGITIVSESGLHHADDINFVANAGAHAVLVGESLLRQSDLEKAIHKLFPVASPVLS